MMARNRIIRLLLTGILAVTSVGLCFPTLLRLYYLVRLPFVWKASSADAVISQQHDNFDLTFSAFGPDYSTTESRMRAPIPMKLHHIHLGSHPPPSEWLTARAECLKYHASWEAFLWNDDQAERFVREHYPHLYSMWKNYPFQIQRVDALRYMVLQKHGGVILDFDLACKRSLEPLRRFEFVAPAAHPAGLSIGMMLASPNHSYVRDLVDSLSVYNQVWPFLPYITVMFSTGCHYASTIYTMQSNRSGLRILSGPSDQPTMHMLNGFVNTPLFRHLGSSSWHERDARLINYFKNLDQRVLFAALVFASAATTVMVIFCVSRLRSCMRDEERQSSSFLSKSLRKSA